MRSVFAALCFSVSLVVVGCTPGVKVRPNPDDDDCGIRYYRPKPYLLVLPAEVTTGSGDKAVKQASDQVVTLELQYLPDFSEEYSIEVTPGLGTAHVDITLEKGWNLTGINQNLDSKFADNVEAVGGLISAAAPLLGTSTKPSGGQSPAASKPSVAARNVPLGYYEAVIDYDRCSPDGKGKKQLYGWRYVGFSPFNGCPLYAEGAHCLDCSSQLYGLTFRNGVMVFQELNETKKISLSEASHRESAAVPDTVEPLDPGEISSLKVKIATALKKKSMPLRSVRVSECSTPDNLEVHLLTTETAWADSDWKLAKPEIEKIVKADYPKAKNVVVVGWPAVATAGPMAPMPLPPLR